MKRFRQVLLSLMLLMPAAAIGAPTDSIYLLATPLTTEDGTPAGLDLHRGHPTLISMFYGSCPHVCPMLIASMRRMERQLDPDARGRLRVLLVSLDPERDTPAALHEIATRHSVDLTRWHFARTPQREVRKLAAVLGIQYRQLPDGEFNHSTIITLLDGEGRIVAATDKIARPDDDFMRTLQRATATAQ